jgi:hypothetical protein
MRAPVRRKPARHRLVRTARTASAAPLAAALAAALVLAVASCSLFDYSGITPKKFAFVYGVSTYALGGVPGSPNLDFPGLDARDVAAMLATAGYTVKSRWVDSAGFVWVDGLSSGLKVGTIQADSNGTPISGAGAGDSIAPSKSEIKADLLAAAGSVGPNDIVVVYFSGHGMPDTLVPPATHTYFIPYGGVMENNSSFAGYPAYSVRDDELGGMLATFATPRRVVILDTCNSGAFIGNRLEYDIVPPAYKGWTALVTPDTIAQAIHDYAAFSASPTGASPYGEAMVIAAAGRDESSYETSSPPFNGHGVMTSFLLQTAASADLNGDGRVTALEAFSLIKAGVDKNWNAEPFVKAAGQMFEPRVSGGPMDFVLF